MLRENILSKKLLYAVLLTLLIYPFQASFSEEYYTIFKKDSWTVESVKYAENDYGCLMFNGDSDLELRLIADNNGMDLSIFYDNRPEINKSLKYFSFRIDNNMNWRDTGSYYDEGWLISNFDNYSDKDGKDFVREFRKGNKFYHLDDNFKVLSWFSLNGSSMAADAFGECVDKEGNYSD